jgi:hypothetical protein
MRCNRPDAAGAVDCRCGCPAGKHVHYRPGTDCGHCGNGDCPVYRPVDAPGWREPPNSPIEDVWQIEGWVAYGSPLPNVRPT